MELHAEHRLTENATKELAVGEWRGVLRDEEISLGYECPELGLDSRDGNVAGRIRTVMTGACGVCSAGDRTSVHENIREVAAVIEFFCLQEGDSGTRGELHQQVIVCQ